MMTPSPNRSPAQRALAMTVGIGTGLVAGLGVLADPCAAQIAFASPEVIAQSSRGVLFDAGDFNRDGVIDLLVIGRASLTVIPLREDGTADPPRTFGVTPADGPLFEADVVDVDRDGQLDIVRGWVSGNSMSVEILFVDHIYERTLGTELVAFDEPTGFEARHDLVVGDLDGDADLDIAYTQAHDDASPFSDERRIVMQRYGGLRAFTREVVDEWIGDSGSDYDVAELMLGDLNDDGANDLLLMVEFIDGLRPRGFQQTTSLAAFLNDDGRFTSPRRVDSDLPWPTSSTPIFALGHGTLADLNGDRLLDLVATTETGEDDDIELVIMSNVGDGRFDTAAMISLLDSREYGLIVGLVARDLDLDGDVDILTGVGNRREPPVFIENLGAFAFGDPSDFPGREPSNDGVQVIDLNRDGAWDAYSFRDGDVFVWRNITPLTNPTLDVPRLAPGQQVTLTIHGARPGETGYVLYSFARARHSLGFAILGGLNLDLGGAVALAASGSADETGRIVIDVTVPLAAPLHNVVLQAVMRRGFEGRDSIKTPFVETRIRP